MWLTCGTVEEYYAIAWFSVLVIKKFYGVCFSILDSSSICYSCWSVVAVNVDWVLHLMIDWSSILMVSLYVGQTRFEGLYGIIRGRFMRALPKNSSILAGYQDKNVVLNRRYSKDERIWGPRYYGGRSFSYRTVLEIWSLDVQHCRPVYRWMFSWKSGLTN